MSVVLCMSDFVCFAYCFGSVKIYLIVFSTDHLFHLNYAITLLKNKKEGSALTQFNLFKAIWNDMDEEGKSSVINNHLLLFHSYLTHNISTIPLFLLTYLPSLKYWNSLLLQDPEVGEQYQLLATALNITIKNQ